jgi:predicted amidophosphoribosyltransferase
MTFSIPSALATLRRFLEFLLDAVALPRRTEALVRALTSEELFELATDSDEPLPYHERAVRALVWELKYRRNPRASALAGVALSERLMAVAAEELGAPLLIPVPMHPTRRAERGYNQTELLCEAALRTLEEASEPKEVSKTWPSGQPHPDWHPALRHGRYANQGGSEERGLSSARSQIFEYEKEALSRTRATPPQQGLPRHERLNNLKGAMQADPARVQDRVCVVVDDVTTTGATFEEAKRALELAGARAVHCIALARS